MNIRKQTLLMTATAALVAAPLLAFGQVQPVPPDGTPGNPPGTAVGRALEQAGDAAGRALERAGDAAERATDRIAPNAATGAAAGPVAVDSARLRGGLRMRQLIGADVYNENSETVGEVEDIVIPAGGGAPVAILSVGGFLGIGDRLVAVPYERLRRAPDRADRLVLPGATREGLERLPAYSHAEAGRRL
ncbi:MAG TPA: PRC-barrel domain-containing protein [Falsiroseomonas sp.]|jgi:sporulation protein YlmC with PRC-barrel domain|nr:PRC-barrel domain-containing protein [Falsiroseomonas sp.]